MRKTPTIFERDPYNRALVLNVPHIDCEWVFAGEGIATRKLDGTCCLIRNGELYKRREIKAGDKQPIGFELADTDLVTGKAVGWVPVMRTPEDRWHKGPLIAWPKALPSSTARTS